MPELSKLKSKKSSNTREVYKDKVVPVNDEFKPFFKILEDIREESGIDKDKFHDVVAMLIQSTPTELDRLVNEQIEHAKGFLNQWGAYSILLRKLKANWSEDKLTKELIKGIKAIINSEESEAASPKKVHQSDAKKNQTASKDAKKSSKLSKIKAKATFNNTKEMEKELEAMMALEEGEKEVVVSEGSELDVGSIPEVQNKVATNSKPSPKKKKPLKKKTVAAPKESRTKGHKRSVIAILNGGEGSGKSKMAQTFPNAFTIDLEDKLFDLIDYDPTLDLQEGEFGKLTYKQIGENRKILFAEGIQPEDDYVVGIVQEETGDTNYPETEENIEAAIGWFMLEGYQFHDSLIIDVGKAIRDASVRTEEIKKGHILGQFEYIPITKSEKALIIPLIHFCRKRGKNLVIITHWEGIYETRKNAQGYDTNVRIGKQPDIKSWMRDLVTWRIDFLKPAESGFDEKFIVDFTKAPGSQYFKLDITDKNLYEIISNPEKLEEEKEDFRKLKRKQQLAEKSEGKK